MVDVGVGWTTAAVGEKNDDGIIEAHAIIIKEDFLLARIISHLGVSRRNATNSSCFVHTYINRYYFLVEIMTIEGVSIKMEVISWYVFVLKLSSSKTTNSQMNICKK